MLKNNYMLVLYGEVLPGQDLETVKERMAKLFNLSKEQVNSLFSGKRKVVKKNIFNDEAMKYKYAIEKAGAVCHVEAEDSDRSNLSMKADSNENKKLTICPKCGYHAQNDNDLLITAHGGLGECPSCGIIVSKYMAQNVPEEMSDENDNKDQKVTGFVDGHIID